MNFSLSRPLHLTVTFLALMVVVVFLLLGCLTFLSERRARAAIESASRLDSYGRACRMIEQAGVSPEPGPELDRRMTAANKALHQLVVSEGEDQASVRLLKSASSKLVGPKPDVEGALQDCAHAADKVQASHVHRMAEMRAELDQELSIALIAPILMLGLLAAVVLYARARVFEPVRALGGLVSRLSEGQLKPAPVGNIDPEVMPLYENYNRLVNQLQQLEAANREHAESLTKEVQAATKALLAQQQSLARAETLAAVGEVAASVAHELRNPIAGIQMTLNNLRDEVTDEDVRERLSLVSDEVTRLGRLLEGMLVQARHTPETPRKLRLAKTVEQLAVLTSYQMPPGVRLASEVPVDLSAFLPEDRFRQAVLNLVLNAAQATADHGGTVVIRAEAQNERLRVSVVDDGPGFPENLLSQPGIAFSTSHPKGTGLGLAIVRRFVRDLGGKLELKNLSPSGAQATMVLPMRDPNG